MQRRLKKLYLNAGQMKAGTTYLCSILRPHREIYFSPEKEINYLSQRYGTFRLLSDSVRLRKAKSFTEIANKLDRPIERHQEVIQWVADYLRPPTVEGWYEDMFKGHRDGQWVADFSNLTCTIPVDGLVEVAKVADDVRVTYCIRDAVSRAVSHAKFHLRFAGQDHDLSRLSTHDLRSLLQSDNIYPQSQSEAHIAALHKVFGDDRLRIIRCEHLWENPRETLNALSGFLGIAGPTYEVKREAINVGPTSEMNEEVMGVFRSVFGSLQERHERLLDRHRNIVIG